jgi:S-adenosylmethionine-diacylglycerol 3-amino-3-carboxypropyl transferase
MTSMGIVFTRAWEDDRLDAELLAIGPGQRALVVAGAGDTALALAAGGGQVVAVDSNGDQLHLAALKLAATGVLPPERLHAWFEARHDPAVAAEYRARVRDALAEDDRAWWDVHIRLFEKGLHRSTGLGRPIIAVGSVVRSIRRDLPGRVESFADPTEQAEWWRRHLRGWVFGPMSHWLMNRGPVLGLLSPDANETARVRRAGWSRGLATRVDAVLERVLVREHPWWRPLASGRAADIGHGATWLDPDRVAGLASAADRVRWVNGDLTATLGAERAGSLDAISVSNVPDWLGDGAEGALAEAVRRAAAPGARVLVRHIVRPTGDDPYVAAGLLLDRRSAELPALDRTALYEAIDLYAAPNQYPA